MDVSLFGTGPHLETIILLLVLFGVRCKGVRMLLPQSDISMMHNMCWVRVRQFKDRTIYACPTKCHYSSKYNMLMTWTGRRNLSFTNSPHDSSPWNAWVIWISEVKPWMCMFCIRKTVEYCAVMDWAPLFCDSFRIRFPWNNTTDRSMRSVELVNNGHRTNSIEIHPENNTNIAQHKS